MKKGLIIFLVFAVVFVLVLAFSGIFNPKGTTLATLNVKATNTTIIVRDNTNNVIANNDILEIGKTYNVTVIPKEDCILHILTINNTNYLNKLSNNKCSFICNENVTIKAISVVDSTLESPPVSGITEVFSVTFTGCKLLTGFQTSSIDDITLKLIDSSNTIVARLSVGDSYEYLVEGERYRVEYSSESSYSNVKITNATKSLGFYTLPYSFTATTDTKLAISVLSGPLATIITPIISLVGSSGEEASEFVVGETYTLQDSAPAGYKSILYVNGQETPLPYTFTYTEDFDFDVEVVQKTGAFVTLPADFVPTFVLTQGTVTEYLSWSGNDGEMRFEDLSEYIGWDLSLRVKYPPYGYDQLSFSLNGGESTTEYHYGQITTDMFENFVLEPGIMPSPPTDVG